MNAVQQASRDILVALVMEGNRNLSDIPDLDDLRSRYHLWISDILLESSIEPWEAKGFLIVARSKDGTSACVRPDKYGMALSALLDLLDATLFEVSWIKEEILTDAAISPELPSPSGWKIFQVDRPETIGGKALQANAAPTGIHIYNTFSPTNNLTSSLDVLENATVKSAAWASWTNALVAALVGVAAILVTLWLAHKI